MTLASRIVITTFQVIPYIYLQLRSSLANINSLTIDQLLEDMMIMLNPVLQQQVALLSQSLSFGVLSRDLGILLVDICALFIFSIIYLGSCQHFDSRVRGVR